MLMTRVSVVPVILLSQQFVVVVKWVGHFNDRVDASAQQSRCGLVSVHPCQVQLSAGFILENWMDEIFSYLSLPVNYQYPCGVGWLTETVCVIWCSSGQQSLQADCRTCCSLVTVEQADRIEPIGWLGGIMVRASDLRSSGRGFDSRLDRYQAT